MYMECQLKLYVGFRFCGWSAPSNPVLFKGHLYSSEFNNGIPVI